MPSPAEPLTDAAEHYDGISAATLAARLGVPRVVALDEVGSTLDVAHSLAAEDAAPAGTVIVADAQTAGRGRAGRSWRSERGAGVWLTIIERFSDTSAFDVLSLRVGLALAPVLDALAGEPVRLKWPNDLYLGNRKLGGVLVEARWRAGGVAPEWAAIGVGINIRPPAAEADAIGLREGVSRIDVLDRCVPAIRSAAARRGPLDAAELYAFLARDLAVGRRCESPVEGEVRGIDACGALLVAVGSEIVAVRSGSLVLNEREGERR